MARRRTRFAGSPAVPFDRVVERLGAPGDEAGTAGARLAAGRFPVRWTRHYLDLAAPADPSDPIRRIAFPDPVELDAHPVDLADPVGEKRRTPVPYVVRKHPDRLVFLVAATCHVYCRFCFRRSFPEGGHRNPRPQDLARAFDYVKSERDLREVILSGGDPLTLADEDLREIVARLGAVAHLRTIRVHTRAPVHDPDRVTDRMVATLTAGLPVRVVVHVDHPRELTAGTRGAIDRMRAGGIEVLNQSVLLAGVNDDPGVLAELSRGLLASGVRPYYLHHLDRVPGAGGFWVDYDRGLAIHRELRAMLTDPAAVPDYVIDLPDGSGKIPVERARAEGRLPPVPA